MIGLSFLTPWAAWLALLAIPIVLLYFLKLRRPPLEVTSLLLWRRVIEDSRVNSPFQRMQRSLLLWLQLAALALLVFAATLPFTAGGTRDVRRTVLLVDCSASMGARDPNQGGGATRLEVARDAALEVVGSLPPDAEACVVAFAGSARALTPFTSDERILRRGLESLDVRDLPADLDEALRLVAGLAQAGPVDRVLLLSDGNLPSSVDVEVPFAVEYRRVPSGGRNVGITAVEAQRDAAGAWQLFVRVDGTAGDSGGSAVGGRLRVELDGEVVGEQDVVVGGGGGDPEPGATGVSARRLLFALPAVAAGERRGAGDTVVVRISLAPDGFDALTADDEAYVVLPPVRPLEIGLVGELAVVERAFAAHEGVAVTRWEPGQPGGFDLVVSEATMPEDVLASTVLVLGGVPPAVADTIERREGGDGAQVIDWRRDAPLLEHVELSEVVLADRVVWLDRDAGGVGSLERRGYSVLVDGRDGPLVLERLDSDVQEFWFCVHPDRTTLPYRVGYPILFANVLEIAARRAGHGQLAGGRTGAAPRLRGVESGPCTVRSSSGGGARSATVTAGGLLRGVVLDSVGLHTIERNGRELARLGTSLLDTRETSLVTVDTLDFAAESGARAAAVEGVAASRPLWRIAVWLAIAVLAFEWWWFLVGSVRRT